MFAGLMMQTLRLLERGLVEAHREIVKVLDRAQITVHRWHTALDPETRRWMELSKEAVGSGSVWQQVKDQPTTQALVEQWRGSQR